MRRKSGRGCVVLILAFVVAGAGACAAPGDRAGRPFTDPPTSPTPGIPPEKTAAFSTPTPPTEAQTQEKLDWLANHPHSPVVDEDGPGEPPETGIFPSGESLWPPLNYRFQNQWAGIGADIEIRVWAGAYGSAIPSLEGQGIVVWASILWATGTLLSMDVITAPSGTTALTITGANSHILTLQTGDGQTFTFDADTKELSDG